MKEISPKELKEKLDRNEDFQLIDVREPEEYTFVNLKGELIPLNTILDSADKISKEKPVIIHCKMGGRSEYAIRILEQKYGFTNLYNLKGGIIGYAVEVDPTMVVY